MDKIAEKIMEKSALGTNWNWPFIITHWTDF